MPIASFTILAENLTKRSENKAFSSTINCTGSGVTLFLGPTCHLVFQTASDRKLGGGGPPILALFPYQPPPIITLWFVFTIRHEVDIYRGGGVGRGREGEGPNLKQSDKTVVTLFSRSLHMHTASDRKVGGAWEQTTQRYMSCDH